MEDVTQEELVQLEDVLNVCLYGQGETANVILNPDAFDLGKRTYNETVTRELLIKNRSEVVPVLFRYKKVAHVNVQPAEGMLLPAQSIELNIIVTPRQYGSVKLEVGFDLLYYNFPRNINEYQIVGDAFVTLCFEVPTVTKMPDTWFNMGITPEYLGEVGFHVDDVRYSTSTEIPKSVMPKKYKQKLKNNNDLIAFPNDRPQSLRPWTNPVR